MLSLGKELDVTALSPLRTGHVSVSSLTNPFLEKLHFFFFHGYGSLPLTVRFKVVLVLNHVEHFRGWLPHAEACGR